MTDVYAPLPQRTSGEPRADLLNDRRSPDGNVAAEGTTFLAYGKQFTVAAPCKTNHGGWRCVTHNQAFPYQQSKDDHLAQYRRAPSGCVLVWICIRHNRPETVKPYRRRITS